MMNNKGIGLAELLITIVVLSVVFLGSFFGFISANKMLHTERLKLEATYLAEEEYERLSSLGFDDPELDLAGASIGVPVTFAANTLPVSNYLRVNYNGSRTYTVTGVDVNTTIDTDGNGIADDDLNYKNIEVNVTYDWS